MNKSQPSLNCAIDVSYLRQAWHVDLVLQNSVCLEWHQAVRQGLAHVELGKVGHYALALMAQLALDDHSIEGVEEVGREAYPFCRGVIVV